jgi:hypothetical protein
MTAELNDQRRHFTVGYRKGNNTINGGFLSSNKYIDCKLFKTYSELFVNILCAEVFRVT